MPAENFERQTVVAADPQRCWEALTDVRQLVDWISILSEAVEHTHLERYSAVLTDRLGPFSLRADLAIRITEVDVGSHIVIEAEGRDRHVDSRIYLTGRLGLEPTADGTSVHVRGRYEVTGRVATFGAPMIRVKASKIIEEFFASMTGSLS